MLDDISDIKSYYDDSIESEYSRMERHQLEFDITWRYLDEYLPATGSILEIGAATGSYTLPLVKRGYSVTAVDFSDRLLEICRGRLSAEGLEDKVMFLVADARDLGDITSNFYDAVLLMGPLYHLVIEEDRITALREAYRQLKPGGIIFSTFISRYGILGDVMKKLPHYIEKKEAVRSLIERGRDPDSTDKKEGFRGYFAEISEVAPLHKRVGFSKLVLAGIEPAISADDDSYNCLQGERRCLWRDLMYEISTEESIIGASRHLLYIGRK